MNEPNTQFSEYVSFISQGEAGKKFESDTPRRLLHKFRVHLPEDLHERAIFRCHSGQFYLMLWLSTMEGKWTNQGEKKQENTYSKDSGFNYTRGL
jgi:hypothetical protein